MMRSKTRWMLAGCTALAAMGAAALGVGVGVAEAGKGGGGGAIPPGTGTIYFIPGYGGIGLWSMNADGSGKTALPTSVRGKPSNQVHGGAHWFLYVDTDTQLHATREDGSSDVQLTTDAVFFKDSALAWGRDDSFVSFIRAESPQFPRPAIEALYRVDIAFDAAGVPSAAGGPVAVPGIASNTGLATWSPSGDRVLWITDIFPAGILMNVTTVATGATTSFVPYLGYPGPVAWSPDGARILFHNSQGGLDTIDPSGANQRNIVSGYGAFDADWSPDSAAIVYGREAYERIRARGRGQPGYYVTVGVDVYRASADGQGKETNLTSELSSPAYAYPVAWR